MICKNSDQNTVDAENKSDSHGTAYEKNAEIQKAGLKVSFKMKSVCRDVG